MKNIEADYWTRNHLIEEEWTNCIQIWYRDFENDPPMTMIQPFQLWSTWYHRWQCSMYRRTKISFITEKSSGLVPHCVTKIQCRNFRCSITFCYWMYCYGSRDSVVGIATSYRLDDLGVGVRVPVGSRIFTSPNRPDRLWGPPNLLSNGYWGLFPQG
jgi:hypothetical protein